MADRTRAARLLSTGAALFAMFVGLFACSSDASTTPAASESSPSTPATVTVTVSTAPTGATATASLPIESTTAAPAPAEPTTTVAPTPAPAPVDGAALLQSALAALGPTYHFNTVVTVGDEVVLTADGDRVGDGTRVGVVRGDVVVQYVITPAGTWVQPEGGEWDELDSPAATADPITALSTPVSVEVDASTADAASLLITVTPASLGLAGTDHVVISAAVEGGALRSVAYTTTVEGQPAVVQATISPVIDGSPVVAPV